MTLERANSLTIVEDVQSRFFKTTAAAWEIRHVCHTRSESPVVEEQHISAKSSSERELSYSRSLKLAPNSIESKSPPVTSRVAPQKHPKRNPLLTPGTVLFEAEKGHWTQEVYRGSYSTRGRTVLHPLVDDHLRLWS